jgi:hypothetical protein
MFRPPSLLASQIVPTAASFLAGQPRLFTSEQNVHRYLRTHRTYYPPDYRQLAERGLSPRKIRSLVGCSRMMPTFPPSPLSFRTAGFPQYGWKAGISDRAFPLHPSLKPAPGIRRRTPALHLPFAHLIVGFGCPVLCRADDSSMRRLGVGFRLRPRGSRSVPGSSVPGHQRLSAPSDPLVGTSRFRRRCDLYAMPSLCGSA